MGQKSQHSLAKLLSKLLSFNKTLYLKKLTVSLFLLNFGITLHSSATCVVGIIFL